MRPKVMINQAVLSDDVIESGGCGMGKEKIDRGVVIINNGLDQNVNVDVEGRGYWATNWQDTDAAPTTVAAGADGFIVVDSPWYEVRVEVTPAGIPTTGTLIIELCKAYG